MIDAHFTAPILATSFTSGMKRPSDHEGGSLMGGMPVPFIPVNSPTLPAPPSSVHVSVYERTRVC